MTLTQRSSDRSRGVRRPVRRGAAAAILAGIAALATGLGTPPAHADQVVVYRAGDHVDPETVARILSGDPVRPPGVRTRTLRLLDDRDARPGRPAAAGASTLFASAGQDGRDLVVRPVATTALSLPVPFAFDSADLLPDARAHLDALAEGIRKMSPDRAIRIEGHTDAVGADGYNQVLSERRAASVKQYLVSVHRIAPERLDTVGYGEFSPLDPTQPNAGINRRVQFRGG